MMKKITALLLGLLLLATACGREQREETPQSQEEESSIQAPSELESLPQVAGTALYRGVVAEIDGGEKESLVVLEQARGTDFGYEALQVALNGDTRMNFSPEELQEGLYLEVYYGSIPDSSQEEAVQAIVANLLPDAAVCIFNGTVLELEEPLAEEGEFLLQPLEGNGVFRFRYDEQTQFYLNPGELQPGDALNVYFSGDAAPSDPLQGFALEVRPYRA